VLTRLTGLSPFSMVISGHNVGHIGDVDMIVASTG
jgi:hypothetical protein